MTQLGQIIDLATDPAVDFLDAIAGTDQILEDILFDLSICGTPTARCRIVGLTIVSTQNLDWQVWLWNKAAGPGAGIAENSFIGYWGFVAANAVQSGIAGDSLYYYFIPGLDIYYVDEDGLDARDPNDPAGRFHIGLKGAGKNQGAGGAIKIIFHVDPTHG